MNKTNIFITGGTGLVGSRITELIGDIFSFTNLSLSNGVDITNPDSLEIIKTDTEHQFVLHLAAKTDVDGCEKDKPFGKNGDAYRINVAGTQNVVDACRLSHKKIIFISTDFVFDGENPPQSGYTEEDVPFPVNWYAKTKFLGEEIIKKSGIPFIIIRIAYPYRKQYEPKKDFVRAIMARLSNNQPVAAITDHKFCPTFIDDIAEALRVLITLDTVGIYHVTGSQSLTPYEAAMQIAGIFGFDKKLITQSTRAEYFKDKALRPFDLTISNAKINKLGVRTKGFTEGLQAIK